MAHIRASAPLVPCCCLQVAAAQQYNLALRGYAPLLRWAEQHVRALHAPPAGHEVAITNGGNHTVEILVSLLCDRGDSILMEEYSYPHMLECVAAPKGLAVVGLPMDAQGIIPEAMEQVCERVADASPAGAPGASPRLLHCHSQNSWPPHKSNLTRHNHPSPHPTPPHPHGPLCRCWSSCGAHQGPASPSCCTPSPPHRTPRARASPPRGGRRCMNCAAGQFLGCLVGWVGCGRAAHRFGDFLCRGSPAANGRECKISVLGTGHLPAAELGLNCRFPPHPHCTPHCSLCAAHSCRYDILIIEDDPYYYLQFPPSAAQQAQRAAQHAAQHGAQQAQGNGLPGGPCEAAAAGPAEPAAAGPCPLPAPLALLRWAGSYVGLDVEGRVARVDSFAKFMSPGLRLG